MILQQRLGVSTISVTHDTEDAAVLANRTIVMRAGTIERESPSRTPERKDSPRLNSEERTIVFSRQNIEKPIRSLAHVSNALPQLHQHRFPAKFLP